MKLKMPAEQVSLAMKPAEFITKFCEHLGPEATDILTLEVLRSLTVTNGVSVAEAVSHWRRPYEQMQELRSCQDLTPRDIGRVMNELEREPHGELAHSISEGCLHGMNID